MRIAFTGWALLAPFIISATEPVVLQPSGRWVLDYAANSCRLSRVFGTGASETVLQWESTAPGQASMLAIGKPMRTFSEKVPARFLPVDHKPFDGTPETATNKLPGILWSSAPMLPEHLIERLERQEKQRSSMPSRRPPPIVLKESDEIRAARQAFAAAAHQLQISVRRSRPVILNTGSLGDPIKAFDRCSRDSLRDWGVDPDLEDKIVRPAFPIGVNNWFDDNDYPAAMLVRGAESDVRVRLLVDASGNVTKCTSLTVFDQPSFAKVVCDKISSRARFEPAELADGTKVPSYYINLIVFRIFG
ncbi:MAG: energy transducer TonB [Sphingomonas sp.]|nr:energy transducer TonB [Sphingomonas sp.]